MNLRMLAPKFRDQFKDYLAEIQAKGSVSGLMLIHIKSGEKRIRGRSRSRSVAVALNLQGKQNG